jgi:hypothetical protein
MALGSLLFGSAPKVQQIQRFTPQQQSALNQLLGMGAAGLQNPTAGFQPIAQRAINRFEQQGIPSIAERFSSLGNNALSSPAFASQLSQGRAGLESELAAQEAQFGQQNISQMLQLLGMGLQPQYESYQTQGEPGLFQQILPTLGRLGMGALGAGLTGGWSAIPQGIGSILEILSGLKKPQGGQNANV